MTGAGNILGDIVIIVVIHLVMIEVGIILDQKEGRKSHLEKGKAAVESIQSTISTEAGTLLKKRVEDPRERSGVEGIEFPRMEVITGKISKRNG